MKIYLDLVFILNFIYDLLLLMTVDITLKRHAKFIRLILSAILGALSLVILFFPCEEVILFIFKIIASVLMILVAFGYKNIKYFGTNMIYLYMCSVILGGFLYFLNVEFSYKREGMVFYFEGLSINYVLLLIVSPIILYLYVREHKKFKSTYNYNYKISIVFRDNKCLECNGFLDTGNKLKDPITGKNIVLLDKKLLKGVVNIRSPIYVPYHSLNNRGLLKCIIPSKIEIENKFNENFLLGMMDDKIGINGVDCILNLEIMETLHD